jgi:hypothetical protein
MWMNDLDRKSFRQEQPAGRRRCPEKEIFDEAGVCNRRSCGNHNTGISGRFLCSELRRIRGWIIGRQQQR